MGADPTMADWEGETPLELQGAAEESIEARQAWRALFREVFHLDPEGLAAAAEGQAGQQAAGKPAAARRTVDEI